MSAFSIAFAKTVLGNEGPYSDHPADRGGETFYGIARRYHQGWEGWPILDSYSLDQKKQLSLDDDLELAELVTEFYHACFWQPLHLCAIDSARLCCELFDSGVNVGTARVGRWLQESINLLSDNTALICDGVIGQVTLGALDIVRRRYSDEPLLKLLNLKQGQHYINLCEHDPAQKVFLRGWLGRVW
jgi:lysozyme family protein